ncbi:MAG: DUF177 domain-containing protein [Eggerthellaceae bacterium]|nr:DUF177 domain-containing protein [Eggerthellaceae bacterium]
MENLRITIPPELFSPAEFRHYEGKLEMPVFKAGPDLYSFAEPLEWSADITNTGDAFLVSGMVEGDAVTSCARCLEDVAIHCMGEIEGYYLIDGDAESSEDMEGDEFDVLPEDHTIDLLPLIQAALLMDMPLLPLCQDDCKGLCPKCGANLNEGDCGCEAAEASDEPSPDNPFAVLKDLKLDEE